VRRYLLEHGNEKQVTIVILEQTVGIPETFSKCTIFTMARIIQPVFIEVQKIAVGAERKSGS
jgi:hypothetical protein